MLIKSSFLYRILWIKNILRVRVHSMSRTVTDGHRIILMLSANILKHFIISF
jgi:hypothetical protein